MEYETDTNVWNFARTGVRKIENFQIQREDVANYFCLGYGLWMMHDA